MHPGFGTERDLRYLNATELWIATNWSGSITEVGKQFAQFIVDNGLQRHNTVTTHRFVSRKIDTVRSFLEEMQKKYPNATLAIEIDNPPKKSWFTKFVGGTGRTGKDFAELKKNLSEETCNISDEIKFTMHGARDAVHCESRADIKGFMDSYDNYLNEVSDSLYRKMQENHSKLKQHIQQMQNNPQVLYDEEAKEKLKKFEVFLEMELRNTMSSFSWLSFSDVKEVIQKSNKVLQEIEAEQQEKQAQEQLMKSERLEDVEKNKKESKEQPQAEQQEQSEAIESLIKFDSLDDALIEFESFDDEDPQIQKHNKPNKVLQEIEEGKLMKSERLEDVEKNKKESKKQPQAEQQEQSEAIESLIKFDSLDDALIKFESFDDEDPQIQKHNKPNKVLQEIEAEQQEKQAQEQLMKSESLEDVEKNEKESKKQPQAEQQEQSEAEEKLIEFEDNDMDEDPQIQRPKVSLIKNDCSAGISGSR